MPIRKQNVDAFGKSWSPIDLPNLERAVKLYERLNYLQDHFAGSLSGTNKIMSQINEQAEIKEELQKLGIKHNEQELKQIIQLIQQRQNENRLMNTSYRGSTSGVINYHPTQSSYGPAINYYKPSNVNGQVNSSNLGNAVATSIMNRRMIQSEMDRMRAAGSIMSDTSLRRAAQINVQNGNAVMTSELKNFGSKMDTVGSIFQVAVNTFSKAVNVFSGLFFKGLNNQARVYEDTFTNISVRTGTTRGRYFSEQTGMASRLYSSGLAGNIANSEVQEMWNKLANIGMDQEQMFSRALDNVLTNKIVPYLATDSKSFNILNEKLDGKFVKDIRGINRLNQEIAGNNYVTQDLLQELIDEMQPVSDAALESMVQGSAELTAMVNKLTPIMGETAAKSYVTQLMKTRKYSDQILRSGTLQEQKTLVDAMGQGINVYDPTQWNDFMALAGNNASFFTNMGPGYNNTMGGLIQNTIGSATGLSWEQMNGIYALQRKGLTFNGIKNLTDLTPQEIADAANAATSDYTNDVNNTLKQIQSNELENLSTWLAAIYEQIGYWGDIVSVLLKGIAGVVGAKIIGGIGKKILGLGGSGGSGGLGLTGIGAGLANGFAKGAPTAIGAGKIGAFTGTAGAVAGAAGVAAGGAMAIKGGMDIYNDLSSGEGWTGKTTASAVGAGMGVAGAGALIALGASNPIGWVALAIGGAALLGRSLYESATNYEKAGKKVEQEFNQVALRLDQEQLQREDSLLSIQDNLEKTGNVEEARRKLIETGLLTEEEENKLRGMTTEELEKNKGAIIDLTEAYLKSTKEFSDAEQDLLSQIKMDKVDEANEAAKSIKTWFEDEYKGKNGNTAENNEVAKSLIINMAKILEAKGRSNWSDDEKTFMERYEKNSREGKWDYDDLKWMIEGGGSWWGISNAIMDNTTDLLTQTEFARMANKRGASIKDYTSIDMNMLPYATKILKASSKQEAEKAVEEAKKAGMVYSQFAKYGVEDALNKWGIPGFRSGLNYVPYDDYTARLHEGEAVITAATANELRNLIVEYRESQQINTSLDTAIQNQTVTLVNKIDEIIKVMQNDSLFPATAENTKLKNMFNNMRYMRTTKSFNQ